MDHLVATLLKNVLMNTPLILFLHVVSIQAGMNFRQNIFTTHAQKGELINFVIIIKFMQNKLNLFFSYRTVFCNNIISADNCTYNENSIACNPINFPPSIASGVISKYNMMMEFALLQFIFIIFY